jgi:hypothetical protein
LNLTFILHTGRGNEGFQLAIGKIWELIKPGEGGLQEKGIHAVLLCSTAEPSSF